MDEMAFILSAANLVSQEHPFQRRVKKSDCRLLRRSAEEFAVRKKWQKAWVEYRRRHPYHQVSVEEDDEEDDEELSNYLAKTTNVCKENLKKAVTWITNSVNNFGF
ncbi:unnamed protein product, partial [Mesorhabditis belari]|uniref:Uncharacterized protein n=1 Tax=Mesorhabditis belari TaxID=2138241 RepID=A0AAF3EYB4_9BILA